ncbi:MAG: DUF1254 domain-containing protein [Oligoflexus sp.]
MKRLLLAAGLACVLTPVFSLSYAAQIPDQVEDSETVMSISKEAYVFGYPLVLMDVTKNFTTATTTAGESKAPINQFAHMRSFPTPDLKAVVSPNTDTLYSTAWLDLSQEPVILSIPNMADRYYLMPILDAWTNVVASPGARTTGTQAQTIAIAGPRWNGELPKGVSLVRSPTNMAWIIGRILTSGPEDFATVHNLQDQLELMPLSAWGTAYTPPASVPVSSSVDIQTPPVEQVANMDATTFLGRLAELLQANPPLPADKAIIQRMSQIGLIPGVEFRPSDFSAEDLRALERGLTEGQTAVNAAGQQPQGAKSVNGWQLLYGLGVYEAEYLFRAAIALVGLGANLTEDAFYPIVRVDSMGQPLSGEHRYVLHFSKEQLPPVRGFWSLTMYNNEQFLVENPIDRYSLGDQSALQFNSDGSLDLYLQHESPGADKEANWLPAPADGFNMILRLYWPMEKAIEGEWVPPAIQRVDE